jgi:hypothetical protein
MRSRFILIVILISLIAAVAITVACGGNSSKSISTSSTALVSTTISDPPTCAAPTGPYSHVYVTISDVMIHTSSTASASDAGWVDLTPNLKTSPKQVDLLSLGGTGCILAQLGSNTNIPAGTYQQIRVILASNTATVASNQCGSTANCVVINGQTSALGVSSSEAQTGIKIPAGQIAGGAFTVAGGENKSLNIDFDACASIVLQGGGGFRLKPTLHAGEVSLVSNAITGKLVDATTKASITGAKAIVALEQKDANGIDRVIMQVTPDATGAFNLCPVPAGTYDVVAVAIVTSGGTAATSYSATITTGIQSGAAIGSIPMTVQTGANTQQGVIGGLITAAGSGTVFDFSVYALQSATVGSTTSTYTIPLAQQQSAGINVTTVGGGTCPTGLACVPYQLGLPSAQPFIGTFATAGTQYTQAAGTAVNYTVDALAFLAGGGAAPNCTQPEVKVSTTAGGAPLTVTPGTTITAGDAAFAGCQIASF